MKTLSHFDFLFCLPSRVTTSTVGGNAPAATGAIPAKNSESKVMQGTQPIQQKFWLEEERWVTWNRQIDFWCRNHRCRLCSSRYEVNFWTPPPFLLPSLHFTLWVSLCLQNKCSSQDFFWIKYDKIYFKDKKLSINLRKTILALKQTKFHESLNSKELDILYTSSKQ